MKIIRLTKSRTNKLIILLLLALIVQPGLAQTIDTVKIGSPLQFQFLESGKSSYIVYFEKEGKVFNISLWERTLTEKGDLIEITQKWHQNDTLMRQIRSLVKKSDFAPVFHKTSNYQKGTLAFNYKPNAIVSADTVSGNILKDYRLDWTDNFFNWELDLELLSLLPYRNDVTFAIPFNHPGNNTVGYFMYNVFDGGRIVLPGQREIDTWRLHIEWKEGGGGYTDFWISKEHQQVIRSLDVFNGMRRHKIRLPSNTRQKV